MSQKNKLLADQRLIAKQMLMLPDQSLLSRAHTKDLEEEWHNIRRYYTLIGLYWRAKTCGESNPLDELLARGQIEEVHRMAVTLMADQYLALWELIYASERFLKREAKTKSLDYPFNVPRELFVHILQSESQSEFLDCLDYKEFSMRKERKWAELSVKLRRDGLNPIEEKKWKAAATKFRPCKWIDLILDVGNACHQKDRAIGLAWRKFWDVIQTRIEYQKHLTQRKPTGQWDHIRSEVWRDGERYFGIREGGTYGKQQQLNKT
ncbi:hypothetical protein H6F86_00460 [Phormidium sp. FACHB-592]|uniref:Uncharacterized protein n=1 Tax=Stenomitos frigidus AS-A4 TaxID=2933935 RepID=A0ABV0KSY3_9CYAN|nr:hypothetical protein [Phormidium sp. FACHB-592]MBD2072406.1 hypothetical protein [Phormidium sp. FACHB-592]